MYVQSFPGGVEGSRRLNLQTFALDGGILLIRSPPPPPIIFGAKTYQITRGNVVPLGGECVNYEIANTCIMLN